MQRYRLENGDIFCQRSPLAAHFYGGSTYHIDYSGGSQGCTELYTIVPSNFTGTCPHEPCLSLNDLASGLNVTFNQSISLRFLDGIHLLEEIIAIQGLPGIEMAVSSNCSQCSPIIMCNGAGMSFQNIQSVEIAGLTFSGCSHQGETAFTVVQYLS